MSQNVHWLGFFFFFLSKTTSPRKIRTLHKDQERDSNLWVSVIHAIKAGSGILTVQPVLSRNSGKSQGPTSYETHAEIFEPFEWARY